MATNASEEIRFGGMVIRFLVEPEQSGGSVSIFEHEVPVGVGVAAGHSHDGFEETIYGLEGVLTWTLAGTPIEVRPGEALLIPHGVVHRFDNNGEVDATVLVIGAPGGLGSAYFLEIAAVLDAATDGPPDHAALGQVMHRHGLTPAP
jgi:quercetin dioxygenase-like cupin family protein